MKKLLTELTFIEQLQFLLKYYPQYFLLVKNNGDKIDREITFSNIDIKIEYDEGKKYEFLFINVNFGFDYKIDLNYLVDYDYGLLFNDVKQDREFKLYIQSCIFDKKITDMRIFGTSTLDYYGLFCKLRCYILGGEGNLNLSLYEEEYKQCINSENNSILKVNRFEILDL